MRALLWNLYAWFFERFTRLTPYQALLEEVLTELAPQGDMRVLDAGCGPGALTVRLHQVCPSLRLQAMDLSSAMLARAKARTTWSASVEFLQTDLDAGLRAAPEPFDRIACVNVLWALPDPGQTLALMAGSLAKGGMAVIVTPRARFRADRIVWEHLRQTRGLARVAALAELPLLAVGGVLNLLLVGGSLLSSRKRFDVERFSEAAVARLCAEAGFRVKEVRPCYASQAFLVRAGIE